jgi:hypothetical protein
MLLMFIKVNSFHNYRTPYWKSLTDLPLLERLPLVMVLMLLWRVRSTFEGELNDYNGTLGYKSTVNDWEYRCCVTVGGNSQTYAVNNSQSIMMMQRRKMYIEKIALFHLDQRYFIHHIEVISIFQVLLW